MAQGVDIEAGDNQGYSALHSACYFGRRDTMEVLLRLGADIEAKGTAGFTPLLSATLGAKPEIVRCLLQEGAYWDVESAGPEKITDVLARAKTEDGDGNPTAEWLECEKFLKNWLDSSYEELFFQHTLYKLLRIATEKCPPSMTGWLRAESAIRLEVPKALSLIRKAERDIQFVDDLHGLPKLRTTAEAGCQYDRADLSAAARLKGPRGEWRLVKGNYEWVEAPYPLAARLLRLAAASVGTRGTPSSTVAATPAGDN